MIYAARDSIVPTMLAVAVTVAEGVCILHSCGGGGCAFGGGATLVKS